ncbi:hypothetical protein SK803_44410 [Lentzea sp. BCCO 10_0856]|uniref:SdpI/YhfL protein family protein n=1 Tax=Lentzea miocenica TaxID=3095431 RepID=A0ABU4TGF4_9PSEU|nr:hypothetical protein [Lentzea sp. BCCO 10_0856]MDX8037281.1 hypothetical protein [Lentzea sp. BCCO 10_0856]
MSGYIDLKDVRISGHVTQVLIVVVAVASVLGTALHPGDGDPMWDLAALLLLAPAAVAFGIWVRNASQNAGAIALREVKQMADVWRASDHAQRDVPFEQRVPSRWIKPWQWTFLAMMASEAAETFLGSGSGYRVVAVASAVLAVVAAALAVVVIAQVSALQRPELLADL